MTSAKPETQALTRRQRRDIAAAHPVTMPASSTRRPTSRILGSVFAGLLAVGLLGGTVASTGAAMAQATAESEANAYEEAARQAQAYVAANALTPVLTTQPVSYDVVLPPTPTPTPTPTSAPGAEAQPAEQGDEGDHGGDSGGFTPPFSPPDPGSAQAIAHEMTTARGWGEAEFTCLVALWDRESGWNASAYNPSSGAYGIPQSLPGDKMASHGADWQTNPATQIAWGLDYIAGRYGAPCGAWAHSESVGWY